MRSGLGVLLLNSVGFKLFWNASEFGHSDRFSLQMLVSCVLVRWIKLPIFFIPHSFDYQWYGFTLVLGFFLSSWFMETIESSWVRISTFLYFLEMPLIIWTNEIFDWIHILLKNFLVLHDFGIYCIGLSDFFLIHACMRGDWCLLFLIILYLSISFLRIHISLHFGYHLLVFFDHAFSFKNLIQFFI